MKIEKINNNTLKIILSIEELSSKDISIKDIEVGKKKAQNFFFDLIEDSAYAEDFLKDNNKLLVEAAISQDNYFIVTITKIEEMPEISKNVLPKKYDCKHTISSLYFFNNISDLSKFINQVTKQSLYVGTNSLYKHNNIYFLTFTSKTIKDDTFKKTYYTLTEYCNNHLAKKNSICTLKEASTLVISKNAIEILKCHIFE